jgi:hypothetical protein
MQMPRRISNQKTMTTKMKRSTMTKMKRRQLMMMTTTTK